MCYSVPLVWTPDSEYTPGLFLARSEVLFYLLVNSAAHSSTSVLLGRKQAFQLSHSGAGTSITKAQATPIPCSLLPCPRVSHAPKMQGSCLLLAQALVDVIFPPGAPWPELKALRLGRNGSSFVGL